MTTSGKLLGIGRLLLLLLGARGRAMASSSIVATRAPFPPPPCLLRRLLLEDLGPPAPPEPMLDVGEAALEEPATAVEAARAVAGDSLFSNVSSSRMRSSRASRKVGKGQLRRRRALEAAQQIGLGARPMNSP